MKCTRSGPRAQIRSTAGGVPPTHATPAGKGRTAMSARGGRTLCFRPRRAERGGLDGQRHLGADRGRARSLGRAAPPLLPALVAIAEASEALARALPGDETAARHAAEERDHVALWDRFAAAAGARPEPPTPETSACIAEWTAGEDALDRLARLYAIEGAQPAIASVKRAGLVERYGFEDGPATDYFRVHAD